MSIHGGPSIRAELCATLRLGLPLVAGQLAGFSTSIVEVVLAGHLGAGVLGAVGVGNNVWMLPVMGLIGVMMALPPSIAQLDGAGRRGEAAALFRQALYLSVSIGAMMGAVIFVIADHVGPWFGIDPSLHAAIAGFLRAASFGGPATGIWAACRGLSDGASRPRATLLASIGAVLLLLPIAWALMYGRLGLPALGAFGSGMANSIVLWVQALGMLAYVRFSPRFADLGWHKGKRAPDFAVIAGILRLGGPMAVSVLLEIGLFSAVGVMIGGLGPVAVSGHQIALNVAAITFMVPLAMAMAVTIRVGNAVGRHDPAGVRRAGLVGFMITLLTQGVSSSLMLLLPGPILRLYTADPAVIQGGAALLALAAIFQLSDGLQVTGAGALRGLKDTKVPMLITALAYWGAGMPVGWYLAFPIGLGARGMWMGLIAGLSVAAVLLPLRFWRHSGRVGEIILPGEASRPISPA